MCVRQSPWVWSCDSALLAGPGVLLVLVCSLGASDIFRLLSLLESWRTLTQPGLMPREEGAPPSALLTGVCSGVSSYLRSF